MLVVVVLLFGICWLPLHVFILVIDFNPHLLNYESYEQMQFFNALYYSVHWLAMSNSFVNPIIYGFLNDSFRHDLRRLLRMWFPCLVLCFACLRDPTLSRGQTMRGLSYYEQKSVSDCGGGSTKRRGQAKSNLHVKMNGYGKCKTDISPEKFHLQPSSKSTCLYSKVSSDNERSDLS